MASIQNFHEWAMAEVASRVAMEINGLHPRKMPEVAPCDNCRQPISLFYNIPFIKWPRVFCVTCRDKIVAAHAALQTLASPESAISFRAERGLSGIIWEVSVGNGCGAYGDSTQEALVNLAMLITEKASYFAADVALCARLGSNPTTAQARFDRLQGAVSGIIEAIGVELEYA